MPPVTNEDLDKRVTFLEFKVDEHDEVTQEMNENLAKINKTMLQVKWSIFGAGALYLYRVGGLDKVIKLMF
ncbi:MAG: hypothetical protein JAY60_18525 [Candidatus Thiodiazotropha weberae]|nr:hypothetical protein [Candidatus Thiodiazotropha weberae]